MSSESKIQNFVFLSVCRYHLLLLPRKKHQEAVRDCLNNNNNKSHNKDNNNNNNKSHNKDNNNNNNKMSQKQLQWQLQYFLPKLFHIVINLIFFLLI
jgi:hypothetical protein